MLPDYIIYDELKKRREQEERRREEQRPRMEVPYHIPLWPEDPDHEKSTDDSSDADMVIVRM